MQRLKGVAVTDGATAGRAVLLTHRGQAVRFPVPPEQVEGEIERLQQSRDRSRVQLEGIAARISHGPGSDLVPLFEAQLLILDDPMLLGRAMTLIREERVNAEWAVHRAFEEIEQVFDGVEDPYLRERKGDVEDVVGRLRMNLRQGSVAAHTLLRHVEGPFVLVADELSPSMAAQIDWTRVRGFAMDAGSRTYHTAILARSLQIPAIVGLHDATSRVMAGDMVVIDGATGELIIQPTAEILRAALARHHQPDSVPARVALLEGPATTEDGVRIRIEANVDLPDDTAVARGYGADGIGLFRSEVLLGADVVDAVSEDQQYEVYRQIIAGMAPKPVTIRTLDLDEHRASTRRFAPGELERRTNDRRSPLGLRGLRLSLSRPDVFRQQLRAMLRAAAHGQLRVLLPFVSSVEEVRAARALLREVASELAKGRPVAAPVQVGVMIEVPSAALTADLLAREVDFLAVGTNDLIQYTLAVDRTDERVADLYQPLHPGILRLLRVVRRAACRAGVRLSVCGEMASDPALLAVLIGLGLTEFSMTPAAIPAARHLVGSVHAGTLRAIVRRALQLGTTREIENYLEESGGGVRAGAQLAERPPSATDRSRP
jgi:phosphoenolpyruvate-protein phosphotransferase (PTS system enzyme I)